MKKIFSSLLIGALLLSGCSIPGFSDEKATPANSIATPVAAIESADLEGKTDEQQFYILAGNNITAWNAKLTEYMPEKALLEKNESNLSIDALIDLSSQMGSGKIDVEINANGKKDISDETNPQATGSITAKVTTSESPFVISADVEMEMRVVENGFYASLQKFSASLPMVPQLDQAMTPFIGKWYGNTFAELSEFTDNQIDVQKFFGSKSIFSLAVEMMEQMEEDPTKVYTFVKALPEKNSGGLMYFEAKINTDMSVQMMESILNRFGIASAQSDEVINEMKTAMEAYKDQVVVVGFNPSDPISTHVESPAINIETNEVIEGKANTYTITGDSLVYSMHLTEEISASITAQDGLFSLVVSDGNETITPLTGEYSTESFTFALSDPENASSTLANGSFQKTENKWNGEITSPEMPNGKVVFSNMSLHKGNVNASIEAFAPTQEGSASLGKVNIAYTISPISDLSIEKPLSAEPFENIEKTLQEIEKSNAQAEGFPLETTEE